MKKYIFDRNDFEWSEEFYEIIKEAMDMPDWFCRNADALWDMLTGYIETPCEVIFKNFDRNENEYNARNIGVILSCFRDAEKEYPNHFKIKFE